MPYFTAESSLSREVVLDSMANSDPHVALIPQMLRPPCIVQVCCNPGCHYDRDLGGCRCDIDDGNGTGL